MCVCVAFVQCVRERTCVRRLWQRAEQGVPRVVCESRHDKFFGSAIDDEQRQCGVAHMRQCRGDFSPAVEQRDGCWRGAVRAHHFLHATRRLEIVWKRHAVRNNRRLERNHRLRKRSTNESPSATSKRKTANSNCDKRAHTANKQTPALRGTKSKKRIGIRRLCCAPGASACARKAAKSAHVAVRQRVGDSGVKDKLRGGRTAHFARQTLGGALGRFRRVAFGANVVGRNERRTNSPTRRQQQECSFYIIAHHHHH